MQKIEILPFDVNNASEDEWSKYHEFRKTRYYDKDSHSSSHQISDEKFEEILKIPPKKINVLRYNVFLRENTEQQIGEVYFSYYKKKFSADVDLNVAMVNTSILSIYRKKGIGTMLLGKLVELAKRHKKSKLLFQTTEKDGLKVIEHFNAKKISEHQQFKLKIREAEWDLVNKWQKEAESKQDKARLEWINVTESIPEEIIEQYTRILASSLDEHPKWHINKRKGGQITPEIIKLDIKNLVTQKGGKWELGIIRERTGDISGLAEIKWNPSRPNTILQLITHIKLHYRGRGRGKLLKSGTLVYIRDNYPHVDTIKIGFVGQEGSPLYEINKRLGFKLQYQQLTYEINTKDLEGWVKLHSQ